VPSADTAQYILITSYQRLAGGVGVEFKVSNTASSSQTSNICAVGIDLSTLADNEAADVAALTTRVNNIDGQNLASPSNGAVPLLNTGVNGVKMTLRQLTLTLQAEMNTLGQQIANVIQGNGVNSNGAPGPAGPQGQGFNWRGPWSSINTYKPYDITSMGGSSWMSITVNTNLAPVLDAGNNWVLFATGAVSIGLNIPAIVPTSVNLTLTTANVVVLATSGSAGIIITLPAASLHTNNAIIVKKVDSGIGAVTVASISGAVEITTIPGQTQAFTYLSDGTTWWTVGSV
jgi:hypothetical protein